MHYVRMKKGLVKAGGKLVGTGVNEGAANLL